MAKKSGKSVKARASSAKTTAKRSAANKSSKSVETITTPVVRPALPSAWSITKTAAILLWQHRKLFAGIVLIYGLLNLILVQGLANSNDISSLRTNLNHAFSGQFGGLTSGLSGFAALVASAGSGSSSNQASGAYQLFLVLLTSLAIIWALRQVLSGASIRIRDTYYRGIYPLVPFILVLLVIGIQLLPLVIGSALYSTVVSNGIAVQPIEKLIWLVIFLLLAAVSLYLICSSIFALYIATLPDMTPMKALRSARELVRHRRWIVLRKLLWLPLVLLVVAAIIMLPIILWLTPLAQWIFFLITIFGLAAVHAYLYALYRELLNE